MNASVGAWILVCVASALVTAVGARWAPSLGWTDAPKGRDRERKLQRRPVPAVGGLALACGLALGEACDSTEASPVLWGRFLPGEAWCWASAGLLLLVGTLDDLRPLRAGPKSLLQLLALLPLALGALRQGEFSGAWLLLGLGFAAVNLLNTFDNADGALAGAGAVGFVLPGPLVCAACLGFLPFNLDAARARNRASGAPSAYLGDAGAFLLGYCVLVTPMSAGILWLPALDLFRLAWVRWRLGARPWEGDRRHLAHRLAARGLGPVATAGVLTLLAAPASLGVARALESHAPWPALSGAVLTFLGFVATLRATPTP